jgi:hypothetical protein
MFVPTWILISEVILVVLAFGISRAYSDDKDQLPPISTPEGKRARIALVSIAVVGISLAVLHQINRPINVTWLGMIAVAIALGLPLLRFLLFKKNQDNKK